MLIDDPALLRDRGYIDGTWASADSGADKHDAKQAEKKSDSSSSTSTSSSDSSSSSSSSSTPSKSDA